MKLVFVGADHEVTGSCHYLEAAGIHMLVDRGMEQGINPSRMRRFLCRKRRSIMYF